MFGVLHHGNDDKTDGTDEHPQYHAEQNRLDTDFPDDIDGQVGTNQEKGDGKTGFCDYQDVFHQQWWQWQKGIGDHCQCEEQDEPGFVHLVCFLFEEEGCHDGDGNDPQCPGQLDGSGDLQRFFPVGRACPDDGGDVMDGNRRPRPELCLGETKVMAQYRKNK